MTHCHFTPNPFNCPTKHTHTLVKQAGWFETTEENCCWGNECTYFPSFVTMVINVEAIRHCYKRTSTPALKDLAVSINVLCPSFATSSCSLNNLVAYVILCQRYFQANSQSWLPCGEPRERTLQAASSCIVPLWVNRTCVCFVLIVSFFSFCRCLGFRGKKKKIEK